MQTEIMTLLRDLAIRAASPPEDPQENDDNGRSEGKAGGQLRQLGIGCRS
jgi:hypothetical protein